MAEDALLRPLCKCHGEPMHQNGYDDGRWKKWRCAIAACERAAKNYDDLSGVGYNKLLLQLRRRKALKRMSDRTAA